MAIFRDTVPREMYEDMKAQRDAERAERLAILEKYHSLRATHQPVQPIKRTMLQPDSAQQVIQAGERAVNDPRLAAAVLKLVQDEGMPEADALREATRMLKIATGETDASGSTALFPVVPGGVPL